MLASLYRPTNTAKTSTFVWGWQYLRFTFSMQWVSVLAKRQAKQLSVLKPYWSRFQGFTMGKRVREIHMKFSKNWKPNFYTFHNWIGWAFARRLREILYCFQNLFESLPLPWSRKRLWPHEWGASPRQDINRSYKLSVPIPAEQKSAACKKRAKFQIY